jgi:hypothetical protein
MEIIKKILAVYSWAVVGVLLVFLWRIAYFYEKTSGQSVRYYSLLFPSLSLAAGALWYLACGVDFIGLPGGDLLLFGGGVLLVLFGFRLQEMMTGK